MEEAKWEGRRKWERNRKKEDKRGRWVGGLRERGEEQIGDRKKWTE